MLEFSHSSQELPQVWPTAGKAAANHYDRDRCQQGRENAAAAEAPEPSQAPCHVMVVQVRHPVSVARILHVQKRSIARARKDHESTVGQPHHPQSLGSDSSLFKAWLNSIVNECRAVMPSLEANWPAHNFSGLSVN